MATMSAIAGGSGGRPAGFDLAYLGSPSTGDGWMLLLRRRPPPTSPREDGTCDGDGCCSTDGGCSNSGGCCDDEPDDRSAPLVGVDPPANLLAGSLKAGRRWDSESGSSLATEAVRLRDDEAAINRPVASFVVVYTMIFFNGCCFTAVVPSVPFYLQVLGAPPSFLGVVVSAYSVGQLIGSPIAGYLSDRRMGAKSLLTISSLLGLFASALYAAAPDRWFVLASRLLVGIGVGVEFTTELAFLARNTTIEERTVFLASATAVNVLGFIVGPALATLFSLFDVTIIGSLVMNEYTSPGWLLVAMFGVDMLMIRCLFVDDSSEKSDLMEDNSNGGATSYGAISTEEEESKHVENGAKPVADEKQPNNPSLILVSGLIFTQFTVMCAWSVLETITSPLAYDAFGWCVCECNILFACGGAASLLAYVSFVTASKRKVEDRWLIVLALVLCFLGSVLMIHWTLPSTIPLPYRYRFVAGYLITNAGFMTGRPVAFALYSKLLPPFLQGEYLGLMVAAGSAARTLGPFVAVYLYYHIEGPLRNTLALFGSNGAMMIACLVLVVSMWPSLLPQKSRR